MTAFLIFVFGLCVGSFLNVVIWRLPRKESLIFPPSHCPSCSHRIPPYDNIPLLSFVLLRGRCRFCRAPISLRYPIVELMTGMLFVLPYLVYGLSWECLRGIVFSSLLIAISGIDIDTMLISDILAIPGTIVGVGLSFLSPRLYWTDALLGAFIGGGVVLFIYGVGKIFFRKEVIGLGDVRLLALIGAFVGWRSLFLVIMVASLVGALFYLPSVITGKRGLASEVPFGPFLAFGGIVAFYIGEVCFYLWLYGSTP